MIGLYYIPENFSTCSAETLAEKHYGKKIFWVFCSVTNCRSAGYTDVTMRTLIAEIHICKDINCPVVLIINKCKLNI